MPDTNMWIQLRFFDTQTWSHQVDKFLMRMLFGDVKNQKTVHTYESTEIIISWIVILVRCSHAMYVGWQQIIKILLCVIKEVTIKRTKSHVTSAEKYAIIESHSGRFSSSLIPLARHLNKLTDYLENYSK